MDLKRRTLPHLGTLGVLLALLWGRGALAADCYWEANSNADWLAAGNWSSCNGGIPGISDSVLVDAGVSQFPVIGTGDAASAGNLFLRYGGELTINGQLSSPGSALLADLPDSDLANPDPVPASVVNVAGNGASWSVGGFVSVGRAVSSGQLNITGGASVSNAEEAYVGESAGASGTVTVAGPGSSWTGAEHLRVGVLGRGALTVSDGAEVSSRVSAIVGSEAPGDGEVTVDNATWSSGNLLYIGNYGVGYLSVANGGQVSNGFGTAGFYEGASGDITVDGTGSRWTNSDEINIGNYGTGSLRITNGGEVVGQDESRVGNYAAGSGTATVDGAGSRWTNAGPLLVGREGQGSLTLSNGGAVSVGAGGVPLVLADDSKARGTLNIGAPEDAAPVAPGTLSASQLVVNRNGTVLFNHTDEGYEFDTSLLGAGTILHQAGDTVYSGAGGAFTGTTRIQGGSFTVTGQLGGKLVSEGTTIATQFDSDGTFSLSGTGSFIKSGAGTLDLTVTDFMGTLSLLRGTARIGPSNLIINSRPSIHVGGCVSLGGQPPANPACRSPLPPSVTTPPPTATPCVGGTWNAGSAFIYRDACIQPGNSIGTIVLDSQWLLAGGATYEVELTGDGNTPGLHNDLVTVGGSATLEDGATVHIMPEDGSLGGGYEEGRHYAIVQAGSLVVAGNIAVTDDYPNLDFGVSFDGQNLYLTAYAPGDAAAPGPVGPGRGPAPGDIPGLGGGATAVPALPLPLIWLAALGVVALAGLAQRRR